MESNESLLPPAPRGVDDRWNPLFRAWKSRRLWGSIAMGFFALLPFVKGRACDANDDARLVWYGLAAISLLVAPAFCVIFTCLESRARRLIATGLETEAQVLHVKIHMNSGVNDLRVEYAWGKRRIREWTRDWCQDPLALACGKVRVLVNPKNARDILLIPSRVAGAGLQETQ